MMTKFEELLKRLEDLLKVRDRIEEDKKVMEAMLEELKISLIVEMPTDVYSNENVALTKQKDIKLKINAKMLSEEYLEPTPARKKIKEAIKFGIPIQGVEYEEVIRLLIRTKNNVEEDQS